MRTMYFCDNCGYQVMEIGFDDLYVCTKCYECGKIKTERVDGKRGCVIRGTESIECDSYSGTIKKA